MVKPSNSFRENSKIFSIAYLYLQYLDPPNYKVLVELSRIFPLAFPNNQLIEAAFKTSGSLEIESKEEIVEVFHWVILAGRI